MIKSLPSKIQTTGLISSHQKVKKIFKHLEFTLTGDAHFIQLKEIHITIHLLNGSSHT